MKFIKDTSFYCYFLFILFSFIGISANYGTYLTLYCWEDAKAESVDAAWRIFTDGFIFLPTIIVALYFIKSFLNKEWSVIPFYRNQNRNLWWFPILMILGTILYLISGFYGTYNTYYFSEIC